LEWLRDVHGAGIFTFYDDTFTLDIKRAYKICEEIKNRGFDLPWDCRTRVNRISTEVLSKMRDANCQRIHFGVESGSQKMLSAMKKVTTVEQNERTIRWTKEVGISVAIPVVVGYPGETADMLKLTFDFIRKTGPDYVYVRQAIPYPGTELYDILREVGWRFPPTGIAMTKNYRSSKTPFCHLKKLMKCVETFATAFFPSIFSAQINKEGLLHPNHGPSRAESPIMANQTAKMGFFQLSETGASEKGPMGNTKHAANKKTPGLVH
jgi:hypothetical protein